MQRIHWYIVVATSLHLNWKNKYTIITTELMDAICTLHQSPNYSWHNLKNDRDKLVEYHEILTVALRKYKIDLDNLVASDTYPNFVFVIKQKQERIGRWQFVTGLSHTLCIDLIIKPNGIYECESLILAQKNKFG